MESSGCCWAIGFIKEEGRLFFFAMLRILNRAAVSVNIITISLPLDFMMEARRSEETNQLRKSYLHRKGASVFFPVVSWEGAQCPGPTASMLLEWLALHRPRECHASCCLGKDFPLICSSFGWHSWQSRPLNEKHCLGDQKRNCGPWDARSASVSLARICVRARCGFRSSECFVETHSCSLRL